MESDKSTTMLCLLSNPNFIQELVEEKQRHHNLNKKVPEYKCAKGPATILTTHEETRLVLWLQNLTKRGFPRKPIELINSVQYILKEFPLRKTPFKNGRPGRSWYSNFMKRHNELKERCPKSICKYRSNVTKEYIKNWFSNLKSYLKEINEEEILTDPNRILNGDETSFSMCPKTGKVTAPKGWKNVYDVKISNEKETITVLLVFNASGETVYPMVVFPYVRPPKEVVRSMPEGWILGKSESGWMRSDLFYEYIANGVNVWIENNKIKKPVILFVDGHKSHLTMEISDYCDKNGIILYALPPNSIHIMMQPADGSVFKPLKSEWDDTVRKWQNENENINKVLTKSKFCPLLNDVLKMSTLKNSIISGFKRCGLYPFNSEAVDYNKCVKNSLEKLNNKIVDINLTVEQLITAEIVIKTLKTEILAENKPTDIDLLLDIISMTKERLQDGPKNTTEDDTILTDYDELNHLDTTNLDVIFSTDYADGQTYDTDSTLCERNLNDDSILDTEHNISLVTTEHFSTSPLITEENRIISAVNNSSTSGTLSFSDHETNLLNVSETSPKNDINENNLVSNTINFAATDNLPKNCNTTNLVFCDEIQNFNATDDLNIGLTDESLKSKTSTSTFENNKKIIPPFSKQLWYAGEIKKSNSSTSRLKKRTPSAISSQEWRDYCKYCNNEDREKLKKEEERQKKQQKKVAKKNEVNDKSQVAIKRKLSFGNSSSLVAKQQLNMKKKKILTKTDSKTNRRVSRHSSSRE